MMPQDLQTITHYKGRITALEQEIRRLQSLVESYAGAHGVTFARILAHILSTDNAELSIQDTLTEEEWHKLYAAIEQGNVSLAIGTNTAYANFLLYPGKERVQIQSKEDFFTRLETAKRAKKL